MKDRRLINFTSALSEKEHPLDKSKKKIKIQYYNVLEYIVNECTRNPEFTNERLNQYKNKILENVNEGVTDKFRSTGSMDTQIQSFFKPWRKKYLYRMMSDLSLILSDEGAIRESLTIVGKYATNKQVAMLEILFKTLYSDKAIPNELTYTKTTIQQFRDNRKFLEQPELKILIVANMSAGKSTLINALVGKQVVRTSQESCTSNLCYIFSKPYEDNSIHLLTSPSLNLKATHSDLIGNDKTNVSFIATYFRSMVQPQNRICYIDTPGVNSVIQRDHNRITRNAIKDEDYDKIICVLNANKIGTDEEREFLKLIAEISRNDDIIFVLNKMDDFKSKEDSISESIDGIRKDLIGFGFENPIICPISAYFAFLMKRKESGDDLSEDEQDAFELYVKKFSRDRFDLSRYSYSKIIPKPGHGNILSSMGLKCGFYGLENILYGGLYIEKSIN